MQRSVRDIEFGFELANTHVEPEERVDGEEPLGERDLRAREDHASLVVEDTVILKGCEYGSEIDPTFFIHKKHDRPYHIDYVFLPREKVDSVVDFSVRTYDEWIEFSDHVPLTVDIEE